MMFEEDDDYLYFTWGTRELPSKDEFPEYSLTPYPVFSRIRFKLPKTIKMDDIDLWIHEFTEVAIASIIVKQTYNVFISVKIAHIMTSFNTDSMVRGQRITSKEFEERFYSGEIKKRFLEVLLESGLLMIPPMMKNFV